MSEAILREDWLAPVELAFEKLKAANTAEREEVCEVVLLDYGSEAEAELKARLSAHDQAMQPKPRLSWRRDLKPAPTPKDAIKALSPDQTPEPKPPPTAEPEAEAKPRVMLPAVVPTPPLPASWDDAIEAMNNRHAIIDNVGGKTVIAGWEPSPLDP